MDNIEQAEKAIDEARNQLGFTMSTTGRIRKDEPIQLALDAIASLAREVRELRTGGSDSGFASGGIDGPFDPEDRPWER